MQLFYNPNIKPEDTSFIFDKIESKHIVKVLRKKVGDLLEVTNGNGHFFTTEIMLTSPSACKVKITNTRFQDPLPYKLHIAVAPTKLNDRYEWFLEKATEIGITSITPIICDHSERKVIKPERYERIIQSAMKQALHAYLPVLNPTISFNEFINLQQEIAAVKLIAHCEPTQKETLKSCVHAGQEVIMLIGPEGDFSADEIEKALSSQFIPVTLGNSRLRTETAAIAAVHSIAFINEN